MAAEEHYSNFNVQVPFEDQGNRNTDEQESFEALNTIGGFVVGGQVRRDDEIITLSSDDERDDWEQWKDDQGGDGEIQLVCVLPKSKSRLISAHQFPIENQPGVDCTYDSGPVFSAASVTDYEHEEEIWSLDPGVKTGFVKEYVNQGANEGLGMIFAVECGLTLFSESHVYLGPDGGKDRSASTTLTTGCPVNFICYQVKCPKFKGVVSEDGFVRIAAALWEPSFGAHVGRNLLREVTSDSHRKELKMGGDAFLNHIKTGSFLPMALARARGRVQGYLNHKIGILKTDDGARPGYRVLFHTSDVYLFRKPFSYLQTKDPIDVLLPIGLNVSFDARAVQFNDLMSNQVQYQACAVFAGSWPKVPQPTLLPGGPGTVAPNYEAKVISGHTFYYLQLGLTRNLDRKWQAFVDQSRGSELAFVRSDVVIKNGQDFHAWKVRHSPYPVQSAPKRYGRPGPMTNIHFFQGAPPSKKCSKIKNETEPAGNAGIKVEVGLVTVKTENTVG